MKVSNNLRSHNTARLYVLPAAFFILIIGVSIYAASVFTYHSPTSQAIDDTPLAQEFPENLLPLETVKKLAAKEAPHTAITKINLTGHDKKLAYAVTLASKRRLIFDAQSGKKLADTKASIAKTDETLPQSFKARIDFARAKQIAQVQVPDGIVREIELNKDGNDVVYTIRFADGTTVDVGADDGVAETTEESTPVPAEVPQDTAPEDSITDDQTDQPAPNENDQSVAPHEDSPTDGGI